MLLLSALHLACGPATDAVSQSTPATAESHPNDEITIEGIALTTGDEENSSSFRAEKVSYRHRKGAAGSVTYHDVADLVVSGGSLSIERSALLGFSSISKAITSLLETAGKTAHTVPDRAGADAASAVRGERRRWPSVSRVIFEQLAIDRLSPELSVEFAHGKFDVAKGTLALEGGVVIRTMRGGEIRAPKAVLSREHDGLYLPLGYRRSDHHEPDSVFLVLNELGDLSATRGAGQISYEDLIEKRERLVLQHYAMRAPPALRPLLFAMLSGMGSPRP